MLLKNLEPKTLCLINSKKYKIKAKSLSEQILNEDYRKDLLSFIEE